jgi:galactose mutarotase-like enzyme
VRTELRQGEDGFERVVCSTDELELTLIPELGAKVVSLLDRATGREWIAAPARRYRRGTAGDLFEDFDRSGWDECFPNVGAGPHPGAQALELVDHGELWAQPWTLARFEDALTTTARGTQLPFTFERRIALVAGRVDLRYAVENTGAEPLPCLWSMHPLLATVPGTRILLPGVTTAYLDEAIHADEYGGYLARIDWPVARTADGRDEDLSRFGARDNLALKLFGRLQRGAAALLDGSPAAPWLAFDFDVAACPWIGVWINESAWPPGAPLQHVAVEPTSSRADRLDVAQEVGETWLIAPGETKEWEVTLRVGQGEEALAQLLGEAL